MSLSNNYKRFLHGVRKSITIYQTKPILLIGVVGIILLLLIVLIANKDHTTPTSQSLNDDIYSVSVTPPKKENGFFGKMASVKSLIIRQNTSVPTITSIANPISAGNSNQKDLNNQDNSSTTSTNVVTTQVSPTQSLVQPTSIPTQVVATKVPQPSPSPEVKIIPSSTNPPAPTQVVSRMYVDVYMHSGNSDYPYSGAKIKFVNRDSGAIIGIVYTGNSGRSSEVVAPANTNVDVFAYPAGSPNTSLCGSTSSFNTGPYGTMQASTLRIYTSGQNPCIHE